MSLASRASSSPHLHLLTVSEGEVEGVVLAAAGPDVAEVAGAGEVFSVLVEADSHHSVRGVERLLDPVTVVNVDIDVEHSLVVLQTRECLYLSLLENI